MNSEALLELAKESLEELKALDVQVIDVRGLTDVTDYMVIATGNSSRQVKSLADNLAVNAKQAGHPALGVEGEREGDWILVDLTDIVVHIMQPDVREFYQLEKLWAVRTPSSATAP